MTKRGRLTRTLARLIWHNSSIIFGTKRRAFQMAQLTLCRDVLNIKNAHYCPERYDRQRGYNKTKPSCRTKRNYESVCSDKRSECCGCKGFDVNG